MENDRGRWNEKWRTRAGELEPPSSFLVEHAHLLPARGRALDVAGGAGRNAVWLAKRGLDVTLIDISEVGIERAERKAETAGVSERIRFLRADLDDTELPAPTFDLVLMIDFLTRKRRDEIARLVYEHGLVIASQPTITNLERHEHPRREHLVEPGEIESWLVELGFSIEVAREGWSDGGRHEAAVIARRTPPPLADEEPNDTPMPGDGPYR